MPSLRMTIIVPWIFLLFGSLFQVSFSRHVIVYGTVLCKKGDLNEIDLGAYIRMMNGEGDETVYQESAYFYDEEEHRQLPLIQGNNQKSFQRTEPKIVKVEITPMEIEHAECHNIIEMTIPIKEILRHKPKEPGQALKVYIGTCNFADGECSELRKNYNVQATHRPLSPPIHFVLLGKFMCGGTVVKPNAILREDKELDKKDEQLALIQDNIPKVQTKISSSTSVRWTQSDTLGNEMAGRTKVKTETVIEQKLVGGPVVDAILANRAISTFSGVPDPIEKIRMDISAADNSCPHGNELKATIWLWQMDQRVKDPTTKEMMYLVDLGECDLMVNPVKCTGLSQYLRKRRH
ncbi:hypothetical protein DdX_18051 [Ditylenchus destructor]|uniref:Uncharacterized protein n=1 Tax=Ditylenchus destructor TaxID=166010 RepID=A0AAD4MKD0_9BILA|nr:hypothetical protein DdX_18051 [Ditylenchus destructor]